jgi:hypothetical protein
MVMGLKITDVVFISLWLFTLYALNVDSIEPEASLFFYSLAAAIFSWKYGIIAGICFAGLGTFMAIQAGAITGNQQYGYTLRHEVEFAFLQMTAVVIGMRVGRFVYDYESNKEM